MTPNSVILLSAHTYTSTYMNVVIVCSFCQTFFCLSSSPHQKNLKNETTVTGSLSNFSQVFIFILIISILFNSLLQLLLNDRNPQTFHPLSVLFSYRMQTSFFPTLGHFLFRCFVSSMPASLKKLQAESYGKRNNFYSDQ